MIIKSGNCRIVILTKNWAIKIPRLNCFVDFMFGCLENLHERYWFKTEAGFVDMFSEDHNLPLAPIRYASRNGLILVMKRVPTVLDRSDLEDPEVQRVIEWGAAVGKVDAKPENLGRLENGKVVWIDYGFFTRNTYLGN